MTEYNYDSFTPGNYDFVNSAGPEIGQKAANFKLETTEGGKSRYLILRVIF